jgi:5-methylcytosine-specific restriction protein A
MAPTKPRWRSWTREEVILALDLYLNHDGLSEPGMQQELSDLLRAWPLEKDSADADSSFRNQQSVRNKLYNLQYLDSDGRQGREKGGEATEAAWSEFVGRAEALAAEAAAIRVAMRDLQELGEPGQEDDPGSDESGVVLVMHRRRERDQKLVGKKRRQRLEQTGALACEACGFDSEAQFGIFGVIECHHLKAVSELAPGERTRVGDLRLVCPNCHRLIHRRRPWLTWPDLRALVAPS